MKKKGRAIDSAKKEYCDRNAVPVSGHSFFCFPKGSLWDSCNPLTILLPGIVPLIGIQGVGGYIDQEVCAFKQMIPYDIGGRGWGSEDQAAEGFTACKHAVI